MVQNLYISKQFQATLTHVPEMKNNNENVI